MSTKRFATPLAALALGAAFGLPAATQASDGGASVGATAPASTTGGSGLATASAAGTTLTAKRTGLVQRRHAFSGRVPHRAVRRTVLVQRKSGRTWTTIAKATPARDGSYRTSYVPRRRGRYTYRALPTGARAASAPIVGVTVFAAARVTYYGPGLYGNRTACGQTLGKTTVGVAHRTLPCGSKVTLLYRGRTVTVPVIDRGPYVSGIDYDLTEATAQRLGMTSTSVIGALPR